jgi:hypothetical protein
MRVDPFSVLVLSVTGRYLVCIFEQDYYSIPFLDKSPAKALSLYGPMTKMWRDLAQYRFIPLLLLPVLFPVQ